MTTGYRTPERVDDVLGLVRTCLACGEEWPRDDEFFYLTAQGKVQGPCRACWADRSQAAYLARMASIQAIHARALLTATDSVGFLRADRIYDQARRHAETLVPVEGWGEPI